MTRSFAIAALAGAALSLALYHQTPATSAARVPTLASATPTVRAGSQAPPHPRRHATLPSVYYRTDTAIYAVQPDGSGNALIATLPSSSAVPPQMLSDGRLLYATSNGFATIDGNSHVSNLHIPALQSGESVWAIAASPDGHSLAWQLFAPAQLSTYLLQQGASRIVITGRSGSGGIPVLFDHANSTLGGQVLSLLGWRSASPFGTGGATLLLQDLYSYNNAQVGAVANTKRGLIEYDPAIDDIVNDYLPPLTTDASPQRAFALSQDGTLVVYGDANAFTPSGEGPLARVISVLNLNTSTVTRIDTASHYPHTQTITVVKQHKVGKHTISENVAMDLHLYPYFSHNAYLAPDNKNVLYTVLTVSYPPGARVPHIAQQAMVSAIGDHNTPNAVAQDAQGEGWLDTHSVVIKRADGLYVVDTATGTTSTLVNDATAHFIGVR